MTGIWLKSANPSTFLNINKKKLNGKSHLSFYPGMSGTYFPILRGHKTQKKSTFFFFDGPKDQEHPVGSGIT